LCAAAPVGRCSARTSRRSCRPRTHRGLCEEVCEPAAPTGRCCTSSSRDTCHRHSRRGASKDVHDLRRQQGAAVRLVAAARAAFMHGLACSTFDAASMVPFQRWYDGAEVAAVCARRAANARQTSKRCGSLALAAKDEVQIWRGRGIGGGGSRKQGAAATAADAACASQHANRTGHATPCLSLVRGNSALQHPHL